MRATGPRAPFDLRCNYLEDPLGIDDPNPRFSWVLDHPERGQVQKAYQIILSNDPEKIEENIGDVWDTGQVESGESVNVPYGGPPLRSGETYYWKVRWWDQQGCVSPYSRSATFEMGLMNPGDWAARWIGADYEGLTTVGDPFNREFTLPYGVLFRKDFQVPKEALKARAYICGLGWYELRINGLKVGDRVLDPGQTDYKKRVLYSTYDITDYLKEGPNAVGVMLGNGRYIKGYGYDSPRLILQINLVFTDGSTGVVISDGTWRKAHGPVRANGIYYGEVYDARLEAPGWDSPGFDDSAWEVAREVEPPAGRLAAQAFPPIKVVKTLRPVNMWSPRTGVFIYDFGQNFTGWAKIKAKGPEGTEIKLRYAELIDDRGELNVKPNRSALATDVYIMKGEGLEVYEPRFTYHGFRYLEVSGFPGVPTLESVEGKVVHSSVERSGDFICSNQLINRIHQNTIWGQLSNLMSVPTDCPQRDERMGWMGDAQLTVEEAIYNFDMAAFYLKYLEDIRDAQKEDGSLSDVIPPYWSLYPADPAWGTAYITVAWYMYLYYGDTGVLKEHYEALRKYVEFLRGKAEDNILTFNKYGDWCPPGSVRPKDTPGEFTSAWYYYHDVLLFSRIARVLGNEGDWARYSELAEDIRKAFNERFLKEGHYVSTSQTCNILPLYLNMPPEDKKKAVLETLVKDIVVNHDSHLDTGIIGTRYLFDVLMENGYAELAYRIATQETYPSWGYMIKEGATTLWERWEKLGDSGMNSHNHIMFGTVDAWFYRGLAGIKTLEPGWRRILIEPHVVGDLKFVSASLKTLRGIVRVAVEAGEAALNFTVEIPVNTQAELRIPKLESIRSVKEGGKPLWEDGCYLGGIQGVTGYRQDETSLTFMLGSGIYRFTAGKA